MTGIHQPYITKLLNIGDAATTTKGKGDALEELICYVFEKVPGITVTRRNTLNTFDSEEIDVAFWNERVSDGLAFLPSVILVECKNWSSAVGSVDVAWFDTKLRNRGLEFGILVARHGITGDSSAQTAAHSIVAKALSERRQLVVISMDEIRALSDAPDLIRLLKEKLCDLAVGGTLVS